MVAKIAKIQENETHQPVATLSQIPRNNEFTQSQTSKPTDSTTYRSCPINVHLHRIRKSDTPYYTARNSHAHKQLKTSATSYSPAKDVSKKDITSLRESARKISLPPNYSPTRTSSPTRSPTSTKLDDSSIFTEILHQSKRHLRH